MGKNLVKVTGFRISDPEILPKMQEIAKKHKRTRNQEVEWALADYIKRYEKENGSIDTSTSTAKVSINKVEQNGPGTINIG